MSKLDIEFKNNIRLILEHGEQVYNRTGIDTITYPGIVIRHDMAEGFPLLTLRKLPIKSAFVEMEGFIHGETDKQWYQQRDCHFWDYWCSPDSIPPTINKNTQEYKDWMKSENNLGPIYGAQWRNFSNSNENLEFVVDQLNNIVNTLKTDPSSRRMVCSAWNPLVLKSMALPPCHFSWQVNVVNNKLNLFFHQRSCDFILGNNLVGYGLLLKLLALEGGFEEGVLFATYNDCHIYKNHIDGAKTLLGRDTTHLNPTLDILNFTSIFNWKHSDFKLNNYFPIEPNIKFPVAI